MCVCVCVCLLPLFSRTVAAMDTKHGYVGKYHRNSRLTETGVLFPRVRHILSQQYNTYKLVLLYKGYALEKCFSLILYMFLTFSTGVSS